MSERPETRALEEATAALMRVVVARLAESGKRLEALRASIADDDDEAARELGAEVEESRRLGWMLAVLASANGSDLLLDRREPRGLLALLDVAHAALVAEGRGIRLTSAPLPQLAPDVGAGWELPHAVATLGYCAGRTVERGLELEFALAPGDRSWVLELPLDAEGVVRDVGRALAERLGEVTCAFDCGRLRWSLPAAWLRWGPG